MFGNTLNAFSPHGFCLLWNPGLMAFHVISDAVIAVSYYSIPFGLAYFVRRRKDLAYRWMFLLFAAFILACGTTHVFDIWTLWHPDYPLQGLVKAVTAVVSLVTAILLWPVLTRALELPSPAQLARVNAELTAEIASRQEAVAKLELEVAERRALAENLHQNKTRLRAILDNAVEGIITIDDRGIVELCNPAAARMFGYLSEEVSGRPVGQLMPSSLRGAHDLYLASYRSTGTGKMLGLGRELFGLRKDGSTFPIEIVVGEFENGGRHFTGFLRDITDRKKLEERLQQQQAELLHAQRLSTAGELAGMMAHELNQPLGAMANYLGGVTVRFKDILDANPMLGEAINETLRLSRRASEVVHGIRDLVRRRESGREWVAIDAIVDETLALVRQELTRRLIKVEVAVAPDLPRIRAQRVHLQQLLLNLFLNAMEAMEATDGPPNGGGQLRVEARLTPDSELEIAVSDTGLGFSKELAEQLFEPFVTTKPEGIGLGLAVCRTIVESHGGRISARSEPGRGANISVILPTEKELP